MEGRRAPAIERSKATDGILSGPPSGLIAMLFIDVEGSTRLATSLGDQWPGVLEAYYGIVKSIVGSSNGWVDGTAGDGFFVTFGDVSQAGRAAVAIQRALRAHRWPAAVGELRVRMGVHVGSVERRAQGYVGLEIHRAARVGAAAHGGQLLMTGVAAELMRDVVPSQPLGAHRLKDFPAPTALFSAVIDGRGAAAFPPPRTLELAVGSLPAAAGSLIGREHELARVRQALQHDGERLVTLLGRGGVGKTSLALAAAHDLFEDYEDGVWWIEASNERDGAGLWTLIARECRVSDEGRAEEAVIRDLGSRGRLLLVLDNLERVANAGTFLDSLLSRLPEARVLATSQLPLRSQHERQLRLDRLLEHDALALLVRTAARLDVRLEDEPACAELVTLVDGLPLAIELAAGRLRLFPVAELARRLRESTDILQDRSRPERHRSLSAALEWTLDLLDPEAQLLFMRLGVFAGAVEIDDVEAVIGQGLDVISAAGTLLDAALLRRVETGDGVVRFGLPEAVRQEASRRLDAAGGDAWRREHAEWQRDLVWPLRIYEIVDSRLVERAHSAAAETQQALAWAWDHDRQLGRQIALGRYALAARAGALQEALGLLDRVLDDPGSDPQVVDMAREHALLRAGPATDQQDKASSLISLLPELSDLYARFLCVTNISIVQTWLNRYDEALMWNDRTLELAREISPLAEASTLAIRADTLLEAARYEDAETAIRQCDSVAGPLSSPNHDLLQIVRAHLASARGDHASALDGYARVLTQAEILGDQSAIRVAVVSLLRTFARAGDEREMLETAGMAQALADEWSEQGIDVPAAFADPEPAVAPALARLGPEGEVIFEAGRSTEPTQRVKRLCALIYAVA